MNEQTNEQTKGRMNVLTSLGNDFFGPCLTKYILEEYIYILIAVQSALCLYFLFTKKKKKLLTRSTTIRYVSFVRWRPCYTTNE